jgi:hypothetical protein
MPIPITPVENNGILNYVLYSLNVAVVLLAVYLYRKKSKHVNNDKTSNEIYMDVITRE